MIVEKELKIDPANMKATTKWSTPTNVTKIRIFLGQHITFRIS